MAGYDFMEGFDYYPSIGAEGLGVSSTWLTYASGGAKLSLEAGRFEGKSLWLQKYGGFNPYARRVVKATTQRAFGFAFHKPSLNGNEAGIGTSFLDFMNSDNQILCSLTTNDIGEMGATINGVSVGVGERIFHPNTWHYVEGEYDSTEKRFSLILDGHKQFDAEDVAAGLSNVTRVQLSSNDKGGAYYDDMYMLYDTPTCLGESRISLHELNADIAVAFTPNVAESANYEMLTEASADFDTTYNASNTVDDVDMFGFAPIGVTPDKIHAMCLITAAAKEDSGTRTLVNRFKHNTAVTEGTSYNLTASYLWIRDIITADPDGGGPLTKEAINAMAANGGVGYRLVL